MPLCPSSLAIGARFSYRTLVVIGGERGAERKGKRNSTNPTNNGGQMHPHVVRIGAKAVANIPTLVHELGASLVGAEPGASAPGQPGLLAQTGGSGGGAGGLYQFIK